MKLLPLLALLLLFGCGSDPIDPTEIVYFDTMMIMDGHNVRSIVAGLPDPMTNKSIANNQAESLWGSLEHKNGDVVFLTLFSPIGSDTVNVSSVVIDRTTGADVITVEYVRQTYNASPDFIPIELVEAAKN